MPRSCVECQGKRPSIIRLQPNATSQVVGALGSPDMYKLCERLDVDFIFGIGPNVRLKKIAALQEKARRSFLRSTP
jgi:hypothetical protein